MDDIQRIVDGLERECAVPAVRCDWKNDFLSANLADGPQLLSDLQPFITWLGDSDPCVVPSSYAPALAASWRHERGDLLACRTIAAVERLYAHLLSAGRPVDREMLAALMHERGLCFSVQAVGAPTTAIDAASRGALHAGDFSALPPYWRSEFERMRPSGGGYGGRFNWAAFFGAWAWAYYYGLNRVGTRLLIVFAISAVAHAVIGPFALPLAVWVLIECINVGQRGNALRYRHLVNGEDPPLSGKAA